MIYKFLQTFVNPRKSGEMGKDRTGGMGHGWSFFSYSSTTSLKYYNLKNHFRPMFLFIPLENIKKPHKIVKHLSVFDHFVRFSAVFRGHTKGILV